MDDSAMHYLSVMCRKSYKIISLSLKNREQDFINDFNSCTVPHKANNPNLFIPLQPSFQQQNIEQIKSNNDEERPPFHLLKTI